MSPTTSTGAGGGLLSTMSSTKFRHGSWYSPILTAVWLYALAAVLTRFEESRQYLTWGIPFTDATWGIPWVLVPVLLAIGVAPFAARSHMRNEPDVTEESGTATRAFWYTAAATTAGGFWLLYSLLNTEPDDVWPAGFGWLLCALIAVGPWYGLLRRKKRAVVAARVEERRVQRAMQYQSDWTSIMAAAGFPGMSVEDKLGTRSGFVLTLQFPPETKAGYKQVKAAEEQIAICAGHRLSHQGIKISGKAIRAEECEDVRFVVLHVRTTDVLNATMSVPDIGKPASIADGIEIGLYEDGSPIIVPMVGCHTEVIGMTGSGKSAVANTMFTQISRCVDALLWPCAVSKLLPLVGPWCEAWWENPDGVDGPVFDMIGGQSVEQAVAVLLAGYQLADERSRTKRKGDKLQVSEENPLVVIPIEESMSLLSLRTKFVAHNGRSMTPSQIVQQVTQLGRSELVHVIRLDQYGLMDSAGEDGNKIRRNTLNRICLKTMYEYDGRAVLGNGSPDTTLLRNNTLLCSLGNEVIRAVAGKSYFVEADREKAAKLGIESIYDVSIAHDKFRGTLATKVAKKLGSVYTERWDATRIADLLAYKISGDDGTDADQEMVPVTVAAPPAEKPKETKPVTTNPGDQESAFGAVPNLGSAMTNALKKHGVGPKENGEKSTDPKPADGEKFSADWDKEAAKLFEGQSPAQPPKNTPLVSGGSVPEPLRGLLAKLIDDEAEFVEYARAAELVGVSPAAELIRQLEASPFDLKVQRPSTIEGRPRGWWKRYLLAAATRLRGES